MTDQPQTTKAKLTVRTIAEKWKAFAPPGGWKERAYYVVKVAYSSANVPHKAIFYSGFLNGAGGSPGGYATLLNPTYDGCHESIDGVHSLVVIREIEGMDRDD